MTETLQTDRLILRPLRASDAGPLTLHASDKRVARMTTAIPHPYPPGAAEAFIEATIKGRRGEEVWAIDATPSDGEELIGVIGFQSGPSGLGYWVGPPYWGAGFATEAVRALSVHLFQARGISALDAIVFSDNAASAAVVKKVGFAEIGRTRVYSVARGETVASQVFRLEGAALEAAAASGWTAAELGVPR